MSYPALSRHKVIEQSLFFQIEPYLPYEFTCEGMLQRVNAFIENQVPLFIVY